MLFRLSRCVGLQAPDPKLATEFYSRTLGAFAQTADRANFLSLGPLCLFIDPGPLSPIIYELLTPDLGAARRRLQGTGMDEVIWAGKGKANLVRDPFGQLFNVCEVTEWPRLSDLADAHPGVRPVLGLEVTDPEGAAAFFGAILGETPGTLTDRGAYVDSGPIRLRLREGSRATPFLVLDGDANIEALQREGATEVGAKAALDPFGVLWLAPAAGCSSKAAVRL